MKLEPKDKFFAIVISVLIIFSIFAWYRERPQVVTPPVPLPSHGWLPPIINTQPSGTVKCPDTGVKTVTVTVDKTPEWMKDRLKDEALIATGIVKPWEANTNVYTFMDLQSGESRMYFDQQPIIKKPVYVKFFELTNIKELGAFYGYGNNGRVVQLYGQWDVFRTGAINWKAKIEGNFYDNKADAFFLVGGAYQWK